MRDRCGECGITFGSAAELVAHAKKQHARGNPTAGLGTNPAASGHGLVCALCGARFFTPQELARHNLGPHPRTANPAVGLMFG